MSAADLSWTLNAYTVLYAALLVPAGRLADLNGRKRVFKRREGDSFQFRKSLARGQMRIGTGFALISDFTAML